MWNTCLMFEIYWPACWKCICIFVVARNRGPAERNSSSFQKEMMEQRFMMALVNCTFVAIFSFFLKRKTKDLKTGVYLSECFLAKHNKNTEVHLLCLQCFEHHETWQRSKKESNLKLVLLLFWIHGLLSCWAKAKARHLEIYSVSVYVCVFVGVWVRVPYEGPISD